MSENVIDFRSEQERRIDAAWERYRLARFKAEASMSIQDGIEAGRAWRQWLDIFMSAEQRSSLDQACDVTTIRRLG